MRTSRVGLLLVLIPTIGSAAFLMADAAHRDDPPPAPKAVETEIPRPTSDESADDSHSQTPQQQPADGEVIGIPLLA